MLEQPNVSYPGRHLRLQEGMIFGWGQGGVGGLVCLGSTANALTIAKQRRESGFKYLFLLNSTLGWPQVPHTEQCPTPFIEAFASLTFFFAREIKNDIQRSQCIAWKHLPTLTEEEN